MPERARRTAFQSLVLEAEIPTATIHFDFEGSSTQHGKGVFKRAAKICASGDGILKLSSGEKKPSGHWWQPGLRCHGLNARILYFRRSVESK